MRRGACFNSNGTLLLLDVFFCWGYRLLLDLLDDRACLCDRGPQVVNLCLQVGTTGKDIMGGLRLKGISLVHVILNGVTESEYGMEGCLTFSLGGIDRQAAVFIFQGRY